MLPPALKLIADRHAALLRILDAEDEQASSPLLEEQETPLAIDRHPRAASASTADDTEREAA